MKYLRHSWTLPNNLTYNKAIFSTILTDVLYLQVAQAPRSPALAIFMLTTTDKNDYFTPCASMRGNEQAMYMYMYMYPRNMTWFMANDGTVNGAIYISCICLYLQCTHEQEVHSLQ